jgi:hypothetical protein
MTTPWDTWVPLIVSFAALAILIIVLSTGSILIQRWYADHLQARKHNHSHEVPEDKSQNDAVARAPQAIADNFSSYKQQQSLHHWANIRLQRVTILFIFVTATIALWQGCEMHEAGRDTNSLANATIRLSTNNRAWVFLQYGRLEVIISNSNQRLIVPFVYFVLHNYGNSPAIIKSVEPHMFYVDFGALGARSPRSWI